MLVTAVGLQKGKTSCKECYTEDRFMFYWWWADWVGGKG